MDPRFHGDDVLETMIDLVVAQKYAKALFSEAHSKNELQATYRGLEEFARVAHLRRFLVKILSAPTVGAEEKRRLIHAVLGEWANVLLERFIDLLVEKRRLNLLFRIVEEFQMELDRFYKVQALRVRTAFPMTEGQENELQRKFEARLASKVRLEVQVKPELIGGLVVETPEYVIDKSLKGQLNKIRKVLAS
jgi:F-type H+-transporting ATPase subunit delta